jgi:DNA-binding transcriptional LysR family regulator
MDWLKCINSFQAVIYYKSFAKAAEALHTAQPTISKQISWLEKNLGIKLIARTSRGLHLTDHGKIFFHESKELLNQWNNIKAKTLSQKNELVGHLNVATSTTTGERLLLPLMAKFLEKNKKVTVNFFIHNYSVDLINENMDVFVTTLAIPTSKLITCETLMPLNAKIVASPHYLAGHVNLKKIENLASHNCLIYLMQDQPYIWQFSNGQSVEINGSFQTNNMQSVICAALQGIGIAFIPTAFIQEELKNGHLKVILPSCEAQLYRIYAYYHRSTESGGIARTYIDYLAKELK